MALPRCLLRAHCGAVEQGVKNAVLKVYQRLVSVGVNGRCLDGKACQCWVYHSLLETSKLVSVVAVPGPVRSEHLKQEFPITTPNGVQSVP